MCFMYVYIDEEILLYQWMLNESILSLIKFGPPQGTIVFDITYARFHQ